LDPVPNNSVVFLVPFQELTFVLSAQMETSNSNMANVWIGLQYNTSLSEWMWADGTALNTNQWNPWNDSAVPSNAGGNCMASLQANQDVWTAHNCDDTTILGVCYRTPSKNLGIGEYSFYRE
jgi:hypothetical protein